jgi:DNA polymerase I-like protein with 3'-5' exonuclease and polymerase domains
MDRSPTYIWGLNPQSHKQVLAALALHGISVPNIKKGTLVHHQDKPECRAYLKFAFLKARLERILGIERSIFSDGRVRCEGWNQLGAVIGRFTSSGPNLQQVPRKWRKAFKAPAGKWFLKIDLEQIEMYIVAVLTGCERLIQFFKEGKDIYVQIAAELFNKKPVRGNGEDEVNDTLRSVAKSLTLGICYGLSVRGFVNKIYDETEIRYREDEGQRFFETFFEMFPEIRAVHDQALIDAETMDAVYTVTGQRRYLPHLQLGHYNKTLAMRKRRLVNTPIQGGAANPFLRAINKFMPLLLLQLPGVEVINLIHDEVCLLVDRRTARPAKKIVVAAFTEAFRELFGDTLTIKLKGQLAYDWAKKE